MTFYFHLFISLLQKFNYSKKFINNEQRNGMQLKLWTKWLKGNPFEVKLTGLGKVEVFEFCVRYIIRWYFANLLLFPFLFLKFLLQICTYSVKFKNYAEAKGMKKQNMKEMTEKIFIQNEALLYKPLQFNLTAKYFFLYGVNSPFEHL